MSSSIGCPLPSIALSGRYVSLDSLGADPTGQNDASTYINKALNEGYSVFLGAVSSNYRIDSTIKIPEGASLFAHGAQITSDKAITLIELSSRSTLQGVRINGDRSVNQVGVEVDGGPSFTGVVKSRVLNCSFDSIGGPAYRVTRSVDKHHGNLIANSSFTNSLIAIQLDVRGEYTVVNSCQINQCNTGVEITGGNSLVSSCVISDCSDGIKVRSGSNDAHGLVSSSLVNHCNRAVRIINPNVKEFSIDGCKFYGGGIQITRSSGVRFNNCVLALNGTMAFDGTENCVFSGTRFNTIPTTLFNWNGNHSKVHFVDSTFSESLTSGNDLFNLNGAILEVERSTSDQTFSTGSSMVDFNSINRNSITGIESFGHTSFWDSGNNSTQNVIAHKTPNSGSSIQITVSLSLGIATGLVNNDDIFAYVVDSITGDRIATLNKSSEQGAAPGLTYTQYSFTGSVPKSEYCIEVENLTGSIITLFHNQGPKSKLIVSGF